MAVVLVAGWTAACATRVDVARVTPTYTGGAIQRLALGVTDHRTYVVDHDKEEWFEGIMRGAFGIPTSLGRGRVTSGEHGTPYPQFATRLAHLLESGLAAGGATDVVVVPLRVGAAEPETLAQLAATGAERRLLVVMDKSRFDFGGFFLHPDYDYDLEVVVADAANAVLTRRRFSGHEADMTTDGNLNFYDNADVFMYRPTLSLILSDPAIVAAIHH